MITIKRSTDIHRDVCWVTHRMEEARCFQLYLGTDVNGAIKAATEAGMSREQAVAMATAEINRRDHNDVIAAEDPYRR